MSQSMSYNPNDTDTLNDLNMESDSLQPQMICKQPF